MAVTDGSESGSNLAQARMRLSLVVTYTRPRQTPRCKGSAVRCWMIHWAAISADDDAPAWGEPYDHRAIVIVPLSV